MKIANRNISAQGTSSADSGQSPATPRGNVVKSSTSRDWRKSTVWGKNKSQPGSSFGGRIPDIFVCQCRRDTTEDIVREFLLNENISVTKVKQASHVNASTEKRRFQ